MNAVATAVRTLDVIGIFPSWEPQFVGGIQRSGKEAWAAIVSRTGNERARAVCYEPGGSKAATILRALSIWGPAHTVLVWHLDLLKLLPFLDTSQARVVLFVHGIEAWQRQDLVTQWLMKRVHLFVTNTDHTWAEFVRHNPIFATYPHRTVHLGVDGANGETQPLPDQTPAAVMVSRLDARQDYKGHREMITAWPLVKAHMPAAQLWIVGGGDLQPDLECIVREQGLTDSIRFFGPVAEDEKHDLIARARCLAMPSHGDGFGLVYLEAMRAGRPCLVSTHDAGREVVNPPEGGLSVNPARTGEVADATIRLLTTGDEWQRWSAQARRRYESHFTVAHFRRRLHATLFANE
jgi:phosphatidylinositol alpha-1,6-mannosyltransferase